MIDELKARLLNDISDGNYLKTFDRVKTSIMTELIDRGYNFEAHPDKFIIVNQYPSTDADLIGFYNDLNSISLGRDKRTNPVFFTHDNYEKLQKAFIALSAHL